MDAATLKDDVRWSGTYCTDTFPHLYGCGHIEGCIVFARSYFGILKFPHLYGCGPIEGRRLESLRGTGLCYFRIFMDAATLKELSIRSDVIVFHPCLQNLHPLYLPPLLLDLLQVFLAQDG